MASPMAKSAVRARQEVLAQEADEAVDGGQTPSLFLLEGLLESGVLHGLEGLGQRLGVQGPGALGLHEGDLGPELRRVLEGGLGLGEDGGDLLHAAHGGAHALLQRSEVPVDELEHRARGRSEPHVGVALPAAHGLQLQAARPEVAFEDVVVGLVQRGQGGALDQFGQGGKLGLELGEVGRALLEGEAAQLSVIGMDTGVGGHGGKAPERVLEVPIHEGAQRGLGGRQAGGGLGVLGRLRGRVRGGAGGGQQQERGQDARCARRGHGASEGKRGARASPMRACPARRAPSWRLRSELLPRRVL